MIEAAVVLLSTVVFALICWVACIHREVGGLLNDAARNNRLRERDP